MRRTVMAAVMVACGLAMATGASAQSRGRGQSGRSGADEDTLPPSVPPKVSTLSPIRGIAGPRLEPGAVLCGSEEDLQHRGEVSRRIADGDVDAGDPLAGCRLINQERGVEVMARHGLGRVQVKLKPSGDVGWTDAYVP